MRAVIVYESFFGSTRAVAEAVADGVRAAAPSADVTTCEVAAATADLDRVDLLVVGAPTHALGLSSRVSRWLQAQFWGDPVAPTRRHRPYGRPSSRQPLRAWLSRLPPHPGLRAAAFDTRIPGRLSGSAAKAVRARLRRRGLVLVARAEGFAVQGVCGPPADGELARASEWGAALVRAMMISADAGSASNHPRSRGTT